MKYVVTLNGKKYDVEVNESEAVITSVSNAAPAAAPVAPVAAAPAPAASSQRDSDHLTDARSNSQAECCRGSGC